ncbi:hypothetical protein B0T18DRAFT_392644 [Schizothecium vesticola]|uniref:Uncharacterized protein n=1 Tax=Schizothecium vesticola TaxID=314040 RepID=A0AA40ER59_9PEZI|nr:hypothetical protein B0T18DRAFT_392644 [Schizothecium vesticola]
MHLDQLIATRHEDGGIQSPGDIESDMCVEVDEVDLGVTVAESEPEFSDESGAWAVNGDMDSNDPNWDTLAPLDEKPDYSDREPIDDDVLVTDGNSQHDYSEPSVMMNLDEGSFHILLAMEELSLLPGREPEPLTLERSMLQRWLDKRTMGVSGVYTAGGDSQSEVSGERV